MDECSARRVKDAVLRILKGQGEHVLGDVVFTLMKDGFQEADIKAAFFRLSAEGEVEITPDWTLKRILSARQR